MLLCMQTKAPVLASVGSLVAALTCTAYADRKKKIRDPLKEDICRQYRQMSGGGFLVSLKKALCSENILNMWTISSKGCEINDAKTEKKPVMGETLVSINEKFNLICLEYLALDDQRNEVSVCISR